MKKPILALTTATLLLSSCEKATRTPSTGAGPDGPAQSARVEITTASGVAMVYVSGGEFIMGRDHASPDEAPAHRVKVTGFLMDKFEVTQEMFARVQLPNPSHWQDSPQKPVERVRWRDAKRYCNERSVLEGLKPCYNERTPDWDCDDSASGYRLPTEAEWEYACRAQDPASEGEQGDRLRSYAWFAGNADQRTHPVGQKKPNSLGLYDLYGNVSEWCEDVYSPTYYRESPAVDPHGPPSPGRDVKRVIRGGSWRSGAGQCGATVRQGERTGDTDACFSTDYCGFRCVRRPGAGELATRRESKTPP